MLQKAIWIIIPYKQIQKSIKHEAYIKNKQPINIFPGDHLI